MNFRTLADIIRASRIDHGLSFSEVSKRCGIRPGLLLRLEAEAVFDDITFVDLFELAEVLELDVSEIVLQSEVELGSPSSVG